MTSPNRGWSLEAYLWPGTHWLTSPNRYQRTAPNHVTLSLWISPTLFFPECPFIDPINGVIIMIEGRDYVWLCARPVNSQAFASFFRSVFLRILAAFPLCPVRTVNQSQETLCHNVPTLYSDLSRPPKLSTEAVFLRPIKNCSRVVVHRRAATDHRPPLWFPVHQSNQHINKDRNKKVHMWDGIKANSYTENTHMSNGVFSKGAAQ